MRTIMPVLLVLALGVSGSMLALSGFGTAWGAQPPRTDAAQEQVNNSGGELKPQQKPVSGPVSAGDSNIVGLVANGLGQIVDLAGAVVLLPVTLTSLGFPAWFAYPLGSVAYILVGVGIIEWATNREWS